MSQRRTVSATVAVGMVSWPGVAAAHGASLARGIAAVLIALSIGACLMLGLLVFTVVAIRRLNEAPSSSRWRRRCRVLGVTNLVLGAPAFVIVLARMMPAFVAGSFPDEAKVLLVAPVPIAVGIWALRAHGRARGSASSTRDEPNATASRERCPRDSRPTSTS